MDKDFFDSEFGKKTAKRRTQLIEEDRSLEEEETEELLKSLNKSLSE
jgi:hypothetical protein